MAAAPSTLKVILRFILRVLTLGISTFFEKKVPKDPVE